jgi:hypothetical protein
VLLLASVQLRTVKKPVSARRQASKVVVASVLAVLSSVLLDSVLAVPVWVVEHPPMNRRATRRRLAAAMVLKPV